jgi:hypothetical protein
MNLPIENNYHSNISLFFKKIYIAYKVIFAKKIVISIFYENKRFYQTNIVQMSRMEVSKCAKLILMKISEDEDMEAKINEIEKIIPNKT